MRNHAWLIIVMVSIVGIATAVSLLGYNYLQLVSEYRARNFRHLAETHSAFHTLMDTGSLTPEVLDQVGGSIRTARDQAVWCTENLNMLETRMFEYLGVSPALEICRKDVRDADAALALVDELKSLSDPLDPARYRLRVHIGRQLETMREESIAFHPYIERLEPVIVGYVVRGTLLSGAVLVFVAVAVSRLLSRSLRQRAEQFRQAEIAKRRFDFAIQSTSDGFALYDSDLRLVACNDTYRSLWGGADPDAIRPGVSVRDVLLLGTGYQALNAGTVENFIDRTVAKLNSKENTESRLELPGDRHIRSRSCKTPFGDKVVMHTDITEFVRTARTQAEQADRLRRANSEIEYRALHDPLTELPNRRCLDRALDTALNAGRRALIRIALDRFKQVNDVLGHKAGDFVLCHVAGILRAEIRDGDLPARVGGDEFVVLCRDGTTESEAQALAERILAEIRKPVAFEDKPCRFGASFGVAQSMPDSEDGGELLSFADTALYAAKNAGRGTVALFSSELHAKINEDRLLGDEFSTALERGQIVPYFQTQHDAKTHDIIGMEVLARWVHPRRGVLSPPAFLNVVRSLGLEGQLDAAIYDQAENALNELFDAGFSIPKVSFNVSAGCVLDPQFLDTVRARFRDGRTRIVFEILESISLEEVDEHFMYTIDALKELGHEIEIDDFGSGHASVASVMDINPHGLKIDRRLVMPLGESHRAERMVLAIVEMGRAMGIRVTAEGVETLDHAHRLAALGCDALQGYVFSYPESFDELRAQLEVANGVLRLAAS